jgi:hypothetical protein
MSMGKRTRDGQADFWVATVDLPKSGGHPFYEQLNRILDVEGFDKFVEERCAKFYAKTMGRPSLAPARYFRPGAPGLDGKTAGIDSTTLEANAALRSIVRRDTGESYEEFLTRLAKASGIETPTRADLAKLDKDRKNKGSNDDWQSPTDPDAYCTVTGVRMSRPAFIQVEYRAF